MANTSEHNSMANAIRFLSADAVEKANSGHPGLPMGAADIATVLFRDVLKFDAADPHWPDRDRFVLSAGHGSMLLYSLLYLTGIGGDKGLTIDDLEQFRQLGSKTPGHPEYRHTVGVETTTGPLGQGIATAVGMAIAERMMAAHFPACRRPSHLCARLRRRSDGRHQPRGDRHRRTSTGSRSSSSSGTTTTFRSTANVSVVNDNVDQVDALQGRPAGTPRSSTATMPPPSSRRSRRRRSPRGRH